MADSRTLPSVASGLPAFSRDDRRKCHPHPPVFQEAPKAVTHAIDVTFLCSGARNWHASAFVRIARPAIR
jgi:hypothetical protein